MYSIVFLLALVLTEFLSQFYLKKGTEPKSFFNNYTLLGIFLYAIVGIVFGITIKHFKFGLINVMWHIAMAISTLIIGVFYFNEKYSIKESIGIGLGVLSMLFLTI